MTRLFALGALTAALLTSTAMAADVLQEQVVEVEDAPSFTLTGTAGIIGFDMPDFDTGMFDVTDDGQIWGGMLGVSGSGVVGTTGDWDVVLGGNAFIAFASGDGASSVWTAYGPGTLVISGLSTPGTADSGSDSIVLTTSGTPSGTVTIVSNNPQGGGTTGSGTASGGTNNVGFVAPSSGNNSFILGAVTTDDVNDLAAAYGAIADTDGGIFIATGNIDGLTVSTSVSRSLIYTGADLTLGLAGAVGDGAAAQVYIGPSYRGLFQETTTDVTIDIPEMGESVVILPEFSISRLDDIDTSYFGGVAGGDISFGAGNGVVFTLGLEGGVYSAMATWTGTDTYSTCCGDFGPDPENGDFQGGASPPLSVTSNGVSADFDDEIAFALRGNAGVTFALNANTALTLGGSVEYLSAVATVSHSGLADPSYTSGTWNDGDGPIGSTTLGWDSMVNVALKASLTGSF